METRAWMKGLLLGLVVMLGAAAAAAEEEVCSRVSAVEAVLGRQDSCSVSEFGDLRGDPIGVVEGDEVVLLRALNYVYGNKGEYVAVLFYASWCPFSKVFRPNFKVMPFLFPTIRHFAFEESAIRPSLLSRYGTHGFPTLLLFNSTMRVRYHGSRTIRSLVAFYTDVTGIKPASVGPPSLESLQPFNPLELKEENEVENCPFSWARSPEKLLQQDTYLALASSFVLLRLLYFLLPKLNACVNRAWRRIHSASLMSLHEYVLEILIQAKQSLKVFYPVKRNEFQEGAMNAKLWASKSLASVSLGEPSSRRAKSASESS